MVIRLVAFAAAIAVASAFTAPSTRSISSTRSIAMKGADSIALFSSTAEAPTDTTTSTSSSPDNSNKAKLSSSKNKSKSKSASKKKKRNAIFKSIPPKQRKSKGKQSNKVKSNKSKNNINNRNFKPLKDLAVGSTISGTVVDVCDFGAFVNIGYATRGSRAGTALLHISQIRNERINNIHDVMKVGDVIEGARVIGVDPKKGEVGLSLRARRQKRKDVSSWKVGDSPDAVCAREAKLLDCLSLASTLSSEKRAAKREQGLRTLFKGITQFATGTRGQELIESRLDEVILPICTQGLTGKASPAEQYASCRVLEATAIVLGHDQDDFVHSILQKLSILVKVIQRAVQVRGAALRALSMACFICSSGGDATEAVLNLCEQVSAPVFREEANPDSLRAVALDCWALLSTTIEDVYLAGNEVPGIGDGRGLVILPLLSKCLDSSNLDLRCAAGECVALIHEARLDLGIDEDEGENLSERRYRRGSWDGSEWEVLMDEVKQRVAELSVESGKHMSKKAKKDQRATFREFMATIVDDEAPEEIVSFRGGQLTLSTWKEIIQLNFVRHCLQSGFQHQLMTNETLQMIFGANGEILNANASLSQLEKRHFMSKSGEAAKKAYKERNKSRKAKIGAKDSFLYADE